MALDRTTSDNHHSPDAPYSLSAQIHSGQTTRILIGGAGLIGALTATQLLDDAESAGVPLTVIVVDDGLGGPSDGSGGWHMPFANPDPRVGQWARDSFDMWGPMLDRAGLSKFRRRTPSIMVSRRAEVPLPDGHPGHATFLHDLDEWGLEFWDQAQYIDDGSVISACALMPRLRRWLEAHPSVVMVNSRLTHPGDLDAIADSFSADAVVVTVGLQARFLLGDERVEGDFGVLLRGPIDQLPEMYKHVVIMDEDFDHELTYSIPHRKCGHVLFGGKCGDIVDAHYEVEQIRAGNADLSAAPDFARAAIDEVYDRIRERMPALAAALPADPRQPGAYWFGLRPRAARVITEWRTNTGTPTLVIGGLGGSGFTIGPAVVRDALRLPMPTEALPPDTAKAEVDDED